MLQILNITDCEMMPTCRCVPHFDAAACLLLSCLLEKLGCTNLQISTFILKLWDPVSMDLEGEHANETMDYVDQIFTSMTVSKCQIKDDTLLEKLFGWLCDQTAQHKGTVKGSN